MENIKYEKGTLGWLREQQNIKAKKDGFDDIEEWKKWKANKIKNLTEDPDYRNKLAQKLGYKDHAERCKEKNWDKGKYSPMSEREDCPQYFGIYIGENYVSKLFEDIKKMPYGNPGYDWICKKGYKIDHKSRCIYYSNGSPQWVYFIDYNNIADYFILSAWDNRDSLNPLHVWMFHKDDIIRGRKFWKRITLAISNKPKYILEFKKYEIADKLEKLKLLCKDKKI